MTALQLIADSRIRVYKEKGHYLAFSQGRHGIHAVDVYRDVFGDGSYLSYSNGRTDFTLNSLYLWLKAQGFNKKLRGGADRCN